MPKSDNITEVVDLDAEQTDVRHNVAPDAEADQQTEVSSNDSPEEDAEDTGRGNNREERFRKERRALATQLAVEQARGAERDRRDIERIAAATLADPTEIWRDGTDMAALLDDQGLPSDAAVQARADELVAARGYLAAPKQPRTPPASIVTGDGLAPQPTSSSFEKAFGPLDS